MPGLVETLRNLFPVGATWRRPFPPVLDGLLLAIAAEGELILGRAEVLRDVEADPRTAVETLSDWERAYGLPDCAQDQPPSGEERRARLLEKVRNQGGSTIERIKAKAALVGYDVEIVETDPYTWEVHAAETTIHYFRAGQGLAGDRLRTWGNEVLECVVTLLQPAHTVLVFVYGGGGAPPPQGPYGMPIFDTDT